MIYSIIGVPGQGKTSTLAWLANHYYEQNKEKIYSNFSLKFCDYTHLVSMEDLDRVKHGRAYLDELWEWGLDARRAMDENNLLISSGLIKARKRKYSIGSTTQGLYQLDKRFRLINDFILFPEILYFDEDMNSYYPIAQDFLNPIDLTPYLDNLRVFVQVTRPVGMSDNLEFNIVDEFDFWLSETFPLFDTSEEVGKIAKGGVAKGIKYEGKFAQAMKELLPDADIRVSSDSGKNQMTMDVELFHKDDLYIFDVITLGKIMPKTKTSNKSIHVYSYSLIDLRQKSITHLMEVTRARNAKDSYFAWVDGKEWFLLPIRPKYKGSAQINLTMPDVQKKIIPLKQFIGGLNG